MTLIRGGSGINIVPDQAEFSIDRRGTRSCVLATDIAVVAGEDTTQLAAEMVALVEQHLAATGGGCSLLSSKLLSRAPAFYQDPDDSWVRSMCAISGQEAGLATYGTNASSYDSGVARACIVMGPGSIAQAHQSDEWVALTELAAMNRIVRQWWQC